MKNLKVRSAGQIMQDLESLTSKLNTAAELSQDALVLHFELADRYTILVDYFDSGGPARRVYTNSLDMYAFLTSVWPQNEVVLFGNILKKDKLVAEVGTD